MDKRARSQRRRPNRRDSGSELHTTPTRSGHRLRTEGSRQCFGRRRSVIPISPISSEPSGRVSCSGRGGIPGMVGAWAEAAAGGMRGDRPMSRKKMRSPDGSKKSVPSIPSISGLSPGCLRAGKAGAMRRGIYRKPKTLLPGRGFHRHRGGGARDGGFLGIALRH